MNIIALLIPIASFFFQGNYIELGINIRNEPIKAEELTQRLGEFYPNPPNEIKLNYPADIIFINAGVVVAVGSGVNQLSSEGDQAIVLKQGLSKKLGIVKGSKLLINPFKISL